MTCRASRAGIRPPRSRGGAADRRYKASPQPAPGCSGAAVPAGGCPSAARRHRLASLPCPLNYSGRRRFAARLSRSFPFTRGCARTPPAGLLPPVPGGPAAAPVTGAPAPNPRGGAGEEEGGARARGRNDAPGAVLNPAGAEKRSPRLPAAPDLRARGAAPAAAAAAHDPALRRVPGERGELSGALGAPRDGGARCRGVP
ncbi:death domain-containing protein CRADD isoform X1 [Pithys albifrons albifrons]|uniref:death domain-containing protein CRADD isoform X1 n=1 Tax=Pithys albifrons albifrons TaxID=3385563 RepID=UPI003A5CF89D